MSSLILVWSAKGKKERERNAVMNSQKAQRNVSPAQAGVQNSLQALVSGLRRNEGNRQCQTFLETISREFRIVGKKLKISRAQALRSYEKHTGHLERKLESKGLKFDGD